MPPGSQEVLLPESRSRTQHPCQCTTGPGGSLGCKVQIGCLRLDLNPLKVLRLIVGIRYIQICDCHQMGGSSPYGVDLVFHVSPVC